MSGPPDSAFDLHCVIGKDCKIELKGLNMHTEKSKYIRLTKECKTLFPNVTRPSLAFDGWQVIVRDGEDFDPLGEKKGVYRISSVETSALDLDKSSSYSVVNFAGLAKPSLSVCYCDVTSSNGSDDCKKPEKLVVNVGTIYFRGAFANSLPSSPHVSCSSTKACSLSVKGYGLTAKDAILIRRLSGSKETPCKGPTLSLADPSLALLLPTPASTSSLATYTGATNVFLALHVR